MTAGPTPAQPTPATTSAGRVTFSALRQLAETLRARLLRAENLLRLIAASAGVDPPRPTVATHLH